VNRDVAIGTTVTNFVTINSNETPPTTANISFITSKAPLIMGDLKIIPQTIRRGGTQREIMAELVLPKGINGNEVVLEPLELIYDSNSISANGNPIVTGTDGRTVVVAVFDTAALMDVVPGYGEIELSVVGKLTTGGTFSGKAWITITRFADS
jgi:hypothetical protein